MPIVYGSTSKTGFEVEKNCLSAAPPDELSIRSGALFSIGSAGDVAVVTPEGSPSRNVPNST
jgi:hypothetical protein